MYENLKAISVLIEVRSGALMRFARFYKKISKVVDMKDRLKRGGVLLRAMVNMADFDYALAFDTRPSL